MFHQKTLSQEQNIQYKKWSILFDIGFQAHDTRLFDNIQADEIIKNEKDIGTYQIGLSVSRILTSQGNYSISMGLGWAREVNTFSRPFDYCSGPPGTLCLDVAAHIDRYYIDQIQSHLNFYIFPWDNIDNTNRWAIYSSFTPYIALIKNLHEKGHIFDRVEKVFEFYSFEWFVGVVRSLKYVDISIGFRPFQIRKFDKLIFNINTTFQPSNIYDPRLNREYDTHNPFKIKLGIYIKLISTDSNVN